MSKDKRESAKNLFFIAIGLDISITALVVLRNFCGAGVRKEMQTVSGRSC